MADAETVTFDRDAAGYRHWRIHFDGAVATLTMAVDPDGGLGSGYDLKLNSYDLGVDIELYDIAQRLRFEHPEVHAVVLTGGLPSVFCAGANIQMLAGASHHHKVNFCKFTNETRFAIEDASANSGQVWIAAVNGTAAGGGYELALTCEEILLVDDLSSAVSLPEVPLLGVLPGTGGLTRLVDKRRVRRDRADLFSTRVEGARAKQALEWGLVDAVAPPSSFGRLLSERALTRAAESLRPDAGPGIELAPLECAAGDDFLRYAHLEVRLDRRLGAAYLTASGPAGDLPGTPGEILARGAGFWPLALARELDAALLHLRFNEPVIGTWVLQTVGDRGAVLAIDELLHEHADHWLVNEIVLYWKRVLKRLDLSSRTLVALITPGSCFAGTLAELVLAADRSFMLDGVFEGISEPPAAIVLSDANFGWYPMSHGWTRLTTHFAGRAELVEAAKELVGKELPAREASELGIVTSVPDELDWDDEVRILLEERKSFSPDSLTGMEANYRFPGPETMESKVFGRLSAWQNWIFQRPNAVGAEGALRTYGTGSQPVYDSRRV